MNGAPDGDAGFSCVGLPPRMPTSQNRDVGHPSLLVGLDMGHPLEVCYAVRHLAAQMKILAKRGSVMKRKRKLTIARAAAVFIVLGVAAG